MFVAYLPTAVNYLSPIGSTVALVTFYKQHLKCLTPAALVASANSAKYLVVKNLMNITTVYIKYNLLAIVLCKLLLLLSDLIGWNSINAARFAHSTYKNNRKNLLNKRA